MSFPKITFRLLAGEQGRILDLVLDGDALREDLVRQGIEQITIKGLPVGDCDVCVEDDSTFIIDYYLDLRDLLVESRSVGRHYASLDDGRLNVSAKWIDEKAKVMFELSDQNGKSEREIDCLLVEYEAAWENLCRDLYNISMHIK